MYGVIMAGGQGTRLFPLTANRPKPMVEVLGRPVIEYVKEAMINSGVDKIIVTTGYRGEMLEDLVKSWSDNSSLKGSIVNKEESPMGTAGSVRLLSNQLNETFIVGSGDSVLSCDLTKLIEAHRLSKAKVTMALWEVGNPSEFGIVGLSNSKGGELDSNLSEGFVSKFQEKPRPEDAFSNVINAGLYIIEPEVLTLIPEGLKFDFSKQLFPKMLELGMPIYGKKISGVWFDVGVPEELIRAQQVLIEQMGSLPFPKPDGNIIEGNGFEFSSVNSTGDNSGSVLSKNVVVGKNTTLSDSLIMADSIIGLDCHIEKSVIGCNVIVEDNCLIKNCIIGDGVIISKNTSIESEKIS